MVIVKGWSDEMNPMIFIAIVREFTAVNLIEAKNYMEKLKSGEEIEMTPYRPETSAEFAEKLLQFKVVESAKVMDAIAKEKTLE